MEEESWRRRTLVKDVFLQSEECVCQNERENLLIQSKKSSLK